MTTTFSVLLSYSPICKVFSYKPGFFFVVVVFWREGITVEEIAKGDAGGALARQTWEQTSQAAPRSSPEPE